MADAISLKDALGSFFGGLQQSGISQAIADAQTQVSDLKAKGLAAADERQQMGTISQNLVMNVGRLGGTAADMEQQRLNLKPQAAQSGEQLYLQGLASGNEFDTKQGKAIMDLEAKRKIQIAQESRQKSPEELALANKKLDMNQMGSYDKGIADLNKKINPYTATSKSVMGRVANQEVGLQEAQALIKDRDLSSLKPIELNELATTLARTALGGVPGEATIKEFSPNTLNKMKAETLSFLKSAPQDTNSPEFAKLYQSMMERIGSTASTILRRGVQSSMLGRSDLVRQGGQKYVNYVADTLGYEPSDIVVKDSGVLALKPGAKPSKPMGGILDSGDAAPVPAASSSAPSFFIKRP